MSSRLFEEIREKRGLAYDIHSSIDLYSDTGVIYFEAGVDDKNLLEVIKLIFNELNNIINLKIDQEELDSAKNLSVGRLLLRLENSSSISSFLGTQKILSNKVTEVNEIVSKINKVTLNEIKVLAQEIFVKDNLCISKVGPKNSKVEDFSNIEL
jgi:predicted Zn-dependent peptidase